VNVYYLSVKGSVKLGVNFSVMFHSTNGNDFCSETGSSTASLLSGSTVGYPSDSLASCLVSSERQLTAPCWFFWQLALCLTAWKTCCCCRAPMKWRFVCTATVTAENLVAFNCASTWRRKDDDDRRLDDGDGCANTCWHLASENVKNIGYQSSGAGGFYNRRISFPSSTRHSTRTTGHSRTEGTRWS